MSIRTAWSFSIAWALLSPLTLGAQNSTPPEEWDAGVLGEAVPLVLQNADIELFNDGPAVQTNLQLTFKNPSRRIVEGVCYIPAADRMVERDFSVDNDGVMMQGQVRTRDRVVRVYRDITRPPPRRQKDPAVLERINENWLRATISPIPAGAEVVINLSAVGLLESYGTGRKFEHLMPTIRGPLGGMIPYRFHGTLPHSDALAIHAPLQRLDHFGQGEYGHDFKVHGPTGHDGIASLFFDSHELRQPVTAKCFRSEQEDGFFLAEVDPSFLLEEPLPAASYIVVLDLPETTSGSTWEASQEMLDRFLTRLTPADKISVITSNSGVGLGSRLKLAKPQAVELARQAVDKSRGKGTSQLSELLDKAFASVQSSDLPTRVLLLSGTEKIARTDEILGDLCQFLRQAPEGSALFSLGLGSRADQATLARLAKWGRGRGFAAKSASHLVGVAGCFVDASRRPILELPDLSIAGTNEVCVDSVRSLTYGDTFFVGGSYHSGGPTLVQLTGQIGAELVDEYLATHLRDNCESAPWVATLWAKRRVDELNQESLQHPSEDMQYFATRLAERFGLITDHTVSLALEPALMDRLPRLVGPTKVTPLLAVVSPFLPLVEGPRRATVPGIVLSNDDDRARRNLLNVDLMSQVRPTVNQPVRTPTAPTTVSRVPLPTPQAVRTTAPRPTASRSTAPARATGMRRR